MASSFSPIRQYGEYIQPYDFNILAKGLEYKQTKFDANTAKVQEQIDQFANVDLAKSQDKEYLASRIQGLVNNLNQNSTNSNFESSGFVRNIQGQIKKVYDDNVINAISSTARARKLQSEIADIKKNSPSDYALQNEVFATRSLNQWMSDGQVGSVYGGGSYNPFYNIQKELLPVLKNLHNFTDVKKVTKPDGNGYYVTEGGKKLSSDEVRSIAEGLLGPQANAQLQIDGWYNFSRGENALESTRTRFSGYKDKVIGSFDNRIADLNVRLSSLGNGKGDEKKRLQEELTSLRNRKESNESVFNSWITTGDIDNMSFTLQKDKLMSGLGEAFGFEQTELTYSTDQSYWKRQELDYKTWKSLLTKQKDSNEDGIPDIVSQARVTEAGEDIDLIGDSEETIENNTLLRDKLLNEKFEQLPSDLQGDLDTLYENRKDKSVEKEDFLFDYFRKLAQDGTSPGLISIEEFEQINGAHNAVLANKQVLNEAFTLASKEQEAEMLPQLFEVAQKNPNIKIAVNGQAMSMAEYFSGSGIESYEDLEKDPIALTEFKKQAYADYLLSKKTTNPYAVKQLASLFGEGGEALPPGFTSSSVAQPGASFGSGGASTLPSINLFAALAGTELNLPSDVNTMKKTMAYLQDVKAAGAYDTDSAFSADDSFQDDRQSNKLLDPDNIRQKMTTIIAGRTSDLPQRNEFLVQTDTDIHQQLMSVVNGQEDNSFLSVDNVAFSIGISPADPGSVLIKQKIKEGTSGGARNISFNEALVPIKNLPTSVLQTVNFANEKPLLNANNFVGKERGDIRFVDEVNTAYLEELNSSVFDGNQNLLQVSTRQGAALNLFRGYSDVLGGYSEPTGVGQLVKNVLDDNQMAVSVEPTKNKDGVRLSIKYGVGDEAETIYSPNQNIDFDNFDQLNKIVDYAPQVIIYNMLESMLVDYRQSGGTVPNGTLEKLARIYSN